MDVNEDPGVDVSSVRMFRHHMENQNLASRPSQAPDFNSIDCRPHGKININLIIQLQKITVRSFFLIS